MSKDQRLDFYTFSREVRDSLRRDPLSNNPPSPYWKRNIEILRAYLNPSETWEEIGKRHSVSSARVGFIVQNTARAIFIAEGKHPELTQTPRLKLPKRPLSDKTRFKRSEAQGGRLEEIATIARKASNRQAIMEAAGIDSTDLASYRGALASLGIEVAKAKDEIDPVRQALTEPSAYQGDLTQLLNSLTYQQFTKFRQEGLLAPLLNSLRDLGYVAATTTIDEYTYVLDKVRFPYGKRQERIKTGPNAGVRNKYFIASSFFETLGEVLKELPEIQYLYKPNNFVQIGGPEVPLPTKRYLLKNRKFYTRVTTLLRRRRVKIPENLEELLSNPLSDTPVFWYEEAYYCHVDFSATLETFIRSAAGQNNQ